MEAAIEVEAFELARVGFGQVALQLEHEAVARQVAQRIAALLRVPVQFGLHASGHEAGDGGEQVAGRDEGIVGREVAVDAHLEVGLFAGHEEEVDGHARADAGDVALAGEARLVREVAHVADVEHVALEHGGPAFGVVHGLEVATHDRGVRGGGRELEVMTGDALVDHHVRDAELGVLRQQLLREREVDEAHLGSVAEGRRLDHGARGDARLEEARRTHDAHVLILDHGEEVPLVDEGEDLLALLLVAVEHALELAVLQLNRVLLGQEVFELLRRGVRGQAVLLHQPRAQRLDVALRVREEALGDAVDLLEALVDAAQTHDLARDGVAHVELRRGRERLQARDVARERGFGLRTRRGQARQLLPALLLGHGLDGLEELGQALDLLHVHHHPARHGRVESPEQRVDVGRHLLEARGDVIEALARGTRIVDQHHEDAVADVVAAARELLSLRAPVEGVGVVVALGFDHQRGEVEVEPLIEGETFARDRRGLLEQLGAVRVASFDGGPARVRQHTERAVHAQRDASVRVFSEVRVEALDEGVKHRHRGRA